MSSQSIETKDLKEALLSMLQYLEKSLNTLEKKDFNSKVIEFLHQSINDTRKCLDNLADVGGSRISKILEKMLRKTFKIYDELNLLNNENTINKFEDELKSFRKLIEEFEATINRQRKLISKYKYLIAVETLTLAMVLIMYLYMFLTIAESNIFILHNTITILSIITFSLITLNIILTLFFQRLFRYVTSILLIIVFLSIYITHVSLAVIETTKMYETVLLRTLNMIIIGTSILLLFTSFSYLTITITPKAYVRMRLRQTMKKEKVFPEKLPEEINDLLKKLLEKYKEFFNDLSYEMLKYEIDLHIFHGSTLKEAIKKIADRLNMISKSKVTEEQTGVKNVNAK